MTTFESPIKQIPYRQEAVYSMLCDLNNINRIKDKLPDDKVKNLTFDSDSISIDAPMAGQVKLKIINRKPSEEIKFETENSPLPFNLWIQILPTSETSSKMKLTLKAELNPFIKGMVSNMMQEAVDKIAEILEIIPYEA